VAGRPAGRRDHRGGTRLQLTRPVAALSRTVLRPSRIMGPGDTPGRSRRRGHLLPGR
jgi:hypothetical protein